MNLDIDTEKLAKMPVTAADGLIPVFHYETRLDQDAMEEDGPPIYKKIAYVEIICPGNDKERINRRVKDADKERWPVQWQRFLQHGEGQEVQVDGMPIDRWPMVDVAQVQTLKASNVHTVEQLAGLADIDVQSLGMGMTRLKNAAQKWLKERSGQNEELEKANERIRELEEKLGSGSEDGVEFILKSGGWYTYREKKYRKADLPDEVRAALDGME